MIFTVTVRMKSGVTTERFHASLDDDLSEAQHVKAIKRYMKAMTGSSWVVVGVVPVKAKLVVDEDEGISILSPDGWSYDPLDPA